MVTMTARDETAADAAVVRLAVKADERYLTRRDEERNDPAVAEIEREGIEQTIAEIERKTVEQVRREREERKTQ